MPPKKIETTTEPENVLEKPEDSESKTDNPASSTVAMTRDDSRHPAPHTADVHPDEVANWQAAGWSVVEPEV